MFQVSLSLISLCFINITYLGNYANILQVSISISVCVCWVLFIYLFTPKIMVCIFQGQSSKQLEKCYIIPGREIPKWLEKVNICDSSITPRWYSNMRPVTIKKVKIQLPGSGSGCDEWRGIVLCVVFLPTDLHHRYRHIIVMSGGEYVSDYGLGDYAGTWSVFTSDMVKLNRITFGCTVCPRTISAFRKLLAALLIRRDSIKLSLK